MSPPAYTRWESEGAFRAWVESPARGHTQAGRDSGGTVAHSSALVSFEVMRAVKPGG
jgi:heme-degrading monooxygenase HmoA